MPAYKIMKGCIFMKKLFKVVLSLFVLIVLAFAGGMFYLVNGIEAGKKVDINGIDMSAVKDGVYTGIYDSGRWSNKVVVTVKDRKITDIKIADDVAFPNPDVSRALFSRVLNAQDTKVDTVSQATVTSKAYLKAIENALN